MRYKSNRKLKRKYKRIHKRNPGAANLFLMLAELADERGQVVTNEAELARLMAARFEDPQEYALKRGPHGQ